MTDERPYDPNTDGCTGWFDGDWKDCCAEHDFYYVNDVGVTTREADRTLRKCIQSKGGAVHYVMGWVMWAGVRLYSKNIRGRRAMRWFD
jgi:hypothetical protein